jgi:hypothetical protein
MNQEILSNGIATNGKNTSNTITLNEISAVPWSKSKGLLSMSTYTFTNAKDVSVITIQRSKKFKTVSVQTAPLPYESIANGNWETVTTWKKTMQCKIYHIAYPSLMTLKP